MQRFKEILKDSIKTGASHLELKAGGVPTLHKEEHKKELQQHGVVGKEWLAGIAKMLFAGGFESLESGQAQQSKLSIPRVGELLLLAKSRGGMSITVYFPPNGETLFKKHWEQSLAEAAEKPPVSTAGEGFEKPQTIGFVPSADFFAAPEESGGEAVPLPPDTKQPPDSVGLDIEFGGATVPSPPQAPLSLEEEVPSPPQAPLSLKDSVGLDIEFGGGDASLAPPAPLSLKDSVGIDFSIEIQGEVATGGGQLPIDSLLKNMVSRRSSDLHLTCGHLIAFRVDGDIVREEKGPPLSPAMLEHLLLPIIPDFKRAQFAKFWDVDFAYALAGVGRFRVNLFRDNHGVGAVFRYIPDKVLTLEELGAPDALFNFCKMAKGLVLVTGPTGSGKSTTQAAMIDFINEARHEHIITIEDPIEFVHPQKKCLINQREVGKHTESFSQALRAALREDPDVVLVGELRDLETTSIALETAETGHLVFGTLHTNTAVSTIDRVIDQYPTEQQRIIRNTLAASLRGVVTQVLCRKKEGGRCAAYEILVTDDAVAAMIREGKNHMIPSHMQTQKAAGNRLLNESLLKLVMEGLVDYEEAWKKSINRKEFEETLKKKGGSRAA